jgi:very-short-patch-repair endonuclease
VTNPIIPYNPKLKQFAKNLRNNSTLSEVLLWGKIKNKALGVEFHRQVPISEFIVDFYCHELKLAIEIDGESHQYKYEYDFTRQSVLESYGIFFIRFTDLEVKQNMNNVIRALEITIETLTSTNITPAQAKHSPCLSKDIPPAPLQRGNLGLPHSLGECRLHKSNNQNDKQSNQQQITKSTNNQINTK